MTGEAHFAPATREDAHRLAPSMRREDALESLAWTGAGPLETLLHCLGHSLAAWTATVEGDVLAMCGVAPYAEGVGHLWMLSGCAVDARKRAFLRAARVGLSLMLNVRPVLVAAVDARYAGAVRLVQWLGFHVMREGQAPGGERFLQVAIGRQTWAQ